MTIRQKYFDTSINSRLIMFIDKIDLPNFSVEIENPIYHRFVSNDLYTPVELSRGLRIS